MASSSSSSSSSSENCSTVVSKQEIKLFHTIDRAIFARLVLKLRRDPCESMHIMALLLWLERCSIHGTNLVYKIQFWPDTLIDALADEAFECLNCIRSDEDLLSHFPTNPKFIIPLIQRLTRPELSPRFFHDHRFDIICGVIQLVQDVCVKAFDDIVEEALGLITPILADQQRLEQNLQPLRFYYDGPNPMLVKPNLPAACNNSGVGEIGDQNMITNTDNSGFVHGVYPNIDRVNLRTQRESLNNEMEELLERVHSIRINNNNDQEVAAHDRTIFLTFSKGYPISENEVKSFFTRKFGNDFAEGIEMQEVIAGEQSLYAKLVLKSVSGIETILNGKPKAKYSINGKHVWARKFVPRNPFYHLQID